MSPVRVSLALLSGVSFREALRLTDYCSPDLPSLTKNPPPVKCHNVMFSLSLH